MMQQCGTDLRIRDKRDGSPGYPGLELRKLGNTWVNTKEDLALHRPGGDKPVWALFI